MANSAHRAIRAAVAALYLGNVSLAGDNVFQNRDYALATGVPLQINVNRVSSDPEAVQVFTGAPIDWQTEIEMRFTARKTDFAGADDACDQLWTDSIALLLANQQLGGLAQQITVGQVSFDQDPGDTNVAEITQRIVVTHRTAAHSIE